MKAQPPPSALPYRGNGSPIGLVGAFPSTAMLLSYFLNAGPLTDGATFVTAGRSAAGDGGGATFRYDRTDTTAADNGGTIRVDGEGRRWKAVGIREPVSVLIFGADKTGKSDSSAAILAANTWANMEGPMGCALPAGTYAIDNSIILPNVLKGAGGVLFIAATKTLTLNAQPEAALAPFFSGAGSLIIAASLSATGYPEWFGAVANSSGTDCMAAINACIQAFPITQLQRGIYYTSGTVLMQTSGRRVQGMQTNSSSLTPPPDGSTICCTSGTADVILVGLGADSSSIGAIHDIDVYGICATRSVAPVPKPSDDFTNVTSWRLWGCLFCYFDHCVGDGSSHAWGLSNTVDVHLLTCQGRILAVGAPGNPDVFSGFYLYGNGAVGIASVIMNMCNVQYDSNTKKISPAGLMLIGGVTDLWVDQFECDRMNNGYSVWIQGATAAKPLIDIYISGGVFDGIPSYGIYATGIPAGSSIHIEKCYFAPINGAASCIGINNSAGAFSLIGNQGTGLGGSGASVVGLNIAGSTSVNAVGNKWTDMAFGVVINGSTACSIRDTITNNVRGGGDHCIAIGAASSNIFVAPTINANSVGVAVDNTCSHIEVNCTAIYAAQAGHPRLTYNGSAVKNAGPFGNSCVASGCL